MSIDSPEYENEDKDCFIYRDPHVTAIHVSPDDNPVINNCDCIAFVHYSKIDKKNHEERNIVLFGGGYKEDLLTCSLCHESLVVQAIESGIITKETIILGGGVLDAHTFELLKSSNLYGKPDGEVLEDFTYFAQDKFKKDGF